MPKFNTEIEARADRLIKAAGQCECPGVGCESPTHTIVPKTPGVAFDIMRCGTTVAASMSPATEFTRVIILHDYDDPTDSANLRVFCTPCGDGYERATRGTDL